MINVDKLNKFYDFLDSIKGDLVHSPVFQLYSIKRESKWLMIWGTLLSSRTSDKVLIKVLSRIKKIFNNPYDVIKYSIKDLENILKPLGFYRMKARVFWLFNKQIIDRYNCQVPSQLEELLKLPGVGLKVGSIILNELYGSKLIGVDIHVFRILNRVGIVKSRSVNKVWNLIHTAEGVKQEVFLNLNRYVVAFGQTFCGRKPICEVCGFRGECDFYKKGSKNDKDQ